MRRHLPLLALIPLLLAGPALAAGIITDVTPLYRTADGLQCRNATLIDAGIARPVTACRDIALERALRGSLSKVVYRPATPHRGEQVCAQTHGDVDLMSVARQAFPGREVVLFAVSMAKCAEPIEPKF